MFDETAPQPEPVLQEVRTAGSQSESLPPIMGRSELRTYSERIKQLLNAAHIMRGGQPRVVNPERVQARVRPDVSLLSQEVAKKDKILQPIMAGVDRAMAVVFERAKTDLPPAEASTTGVETDLPGAKAVFEGVLGVLKTSIDGLQPSNPVDQIFLEQLNGKIIQILEAMKDFEKREQKNLLIQLPSGEEYDFLLALEDVNIILRRKSDEVFKEALDEYGAKIGEVKKYVQQAIDLITTDKTQAATAFTKAIAVLHDYMDTLDPHTTRGEKFLYYLGRRINTIANDLKAKEESQRQKDEQWPPRLFDDDDFYFQLATLETQVQKKIEQIYPPQRARIPVVNNALWLGEVGRGAAAGQVDPGLANSLDKLADELPPEPTNA